MEQKNPMKNVALLTSRNIDHHVMHDDYLHQSFLKRAGLLTKSVIWDDPSVNWSSFDFAIVRTTWDYTQRAMEFLDRLGSLSDFGVKLFNPLPLIQWNVNKIYLRDLARQGVTIVPSFFFDEEDFISRIQQFSTDRWIVKPRVGASAEGHKFVTGDELEQLYRSSSQHLDSLFVQPFCEEIANGECSFFCFNSEFKYAIKKVPKTGDYRVQEEFGGLLSRYHPADHELAEVKRVIDAVDRFSPLYTRIDMIQSTDGRFLLMELEAIEPSMYFKYYPQGADQFVDAFLARS